MAPDKLVLLLLLSLPAAACAAWQPVIVYQPSHQSDTGASFNEARTANAIVEYAMAAPPRFDEHKVWSYYQPGLHHSDTGVNTVIAHTSAVVDGKLSGYAWELRRSNELKPLVFIGVQNNSGTGRHAVWGYIHDGDEHMEQNRRLADYIIEAVARATDLENRGTHLDSSPGRNDYRCAATGRPGFYSIDENVNSAPYRVLLEIGDVEKSRKFLLDEENRKAIGQAIKQGLAKFLEVE